MLKSPPHVLSLIFWAVWLYNFFQPFAGLWGTGVYWLGLAAFGRTHFQAWI